MSREDDLLYDIARRVTDEVLGEGTYAEINAGNPDPGVQAAIARAKDTTPVCTCGAVEYNAPVQHLRPCPLADDEEVR